MNRPDHKRLSKQKNLGNSKIHAYSHINAHINTQVSIKGNHWNKKMQIFLNTKRKFLKGQIPTRERKRVNVNNKNGNYRIRNSNILIISINLIGLTHLLKRFSNGFIKKNPVLYCVQETHLNTVILKVKKRDIQKHHRPMETIRKHLNGQSRTWAKKSLNTSEYTF